jgi:phosphocarrier protein HPr
MPENCEATFTLTGDLHARPAGALSVAAAQFSSAVQLAVGGGAEVDAKSVLSVMQLGASSGQEVTVRAVGPDAQEAVDTLIGILSEATKVGDLRFAVVRRAQPGDALREDLRDPGERVQAAVGDPFGRFVVLRAQCARRPQERPPPGWVGEEVQVVGGVARRAARSGVQDGLRAPGLRRDADDEHAVARPGAT